jgi:hypothetical protein
MGSDRRLRNSCERLTKIVAPIKVDEGRVRGLFCCLLGGRTIGSTSDSGSDYPGSSPGLPANLLAPRPQLISVSELLEIYCDFRYGETACLDRTTDPKA